MARSSSGGIRWRSSEPGRPRDRSAAGFAIHGPIRRRRGAIDAFATIMRTGPFPGAVGWTGSAASRRAFTDAGLRAGTCQIPPWESTMIRKIFRSLLTWATFFVPLASPGLADILFNGAPNIDDERLYAWYDGNEAIGQDGNPATPVWPNKQGDLHRDIDYAFCGACIGAELEPVLTENEQMALRYVGVATQRERGEYDMDAQEYDQWGALEGQFTVFVAATVRDADEAYFFSGIKQTEKPSALPTEVSANYPPEEVAPGRWTIRSESLIQTIPVIADELQFHAFTFHEDGMGQHHVNGDLAGQAYVGTPWMEGFVLGGRKDSTNERPWILRKYCCTTKR